MRFQRNLQEDQQFCITQCKLPAVKGNFKTHLCHLAKVRRFFCLLLLNIISYRRPNRSLQLYPLFPWLRIMILKIHKSRMQLPVDFYKTHLCHLAMVNRVEMNVFINLDSNFHWYLFSHHQLIQSMRATLALNCDVCPLLIPASIGWYYTINQMSFSIVLDCYSWFDTF